MQNAWSFMTSCLASHWNHGHLCYREIEARMSYRGSDGQLLFLITSEMRTLYDDRYMIMPFVCVGNSSRHMSLRRILGWQRGLVVMPSPQAPHGSGKSSPGFESVPRFKLACTTRGSAAPGCAGHKDRDAKHNPTHFPPSPPLQPVYLRSRLGSRG